MNANGFHHFPQSVSELRNAGPEAAASAALSEKIKNGRLA
jgi:hypothetical protein